MRKSTARKIKAEKQAVFTQFLERWGLLEDYGTDEVDVVDGKTYVKVRLLVALIDSERSWHDGDEEQPNRNGGTISNVALAWLFNQPEEHIPGVRELFTEMIHRHRHGISGGLGSEQHEFAKGAVARVLSGLTPEQVETAKAATQRLAERLVAVFPASTILQPPDQAATPEEIIDFHQQDSTNYARVN